MGPARTVELAAAVSNAGGLGTLSQGGPLSNPNEAKRYMRTHLSDLLELTDGGVAVNVPVGKIDAPIQNIRTRDGYLDETLRLVTEDEDVNRQLQVLITSFGNPERRMEDINRAKEDGDFLHFHKVGSVRHARNVEELGADGVIAAGYEMGGHTHHPDDAIHTFVLVPNVAEAVDIPVVAAGGVKDGRSLLAALSLGAQGVSMGTRFLLSKESGFAQAYKEYIVDSGEGSDTVVEKLPARVKQNPGLEDYLEKIEDLDLGDTIELEQEKSIKAQSSGNVEDGLLAAGQVGNYIESVESAEDIVHGTVDEAREMHERIRGFVADND